MKDKCCNFSEIEKDFIKNFEKNNPIVAALYQETTLNYEMYCREILDEIELEGNNK